MVGVNLDLASMCRAEDLIDGISLDSSNDGEQLGTARALTRANEAIDGTLVGNSTTDFNRIVRQVVGKIWWTPWPIQRSVVHLLKSHITGTH